MNTFVNLSDWWFRSFWALSWQITVLAAMVWLVSLAFRRASPSFRYGLWCIVLIRLCVPVSIALPVGVSGDVRRAVETSAPEFLLAAQRTVLSPASPSTEGTNRMPTASSAQEPESLPATNIVSKEFLEPLRNAKLALGWSACVLGILTLVAFRSLRVRRLTHRGSEIKRPELLECVDALRSKYSITRTVRVRMLPDGQLEHGPAVAGILRPTILLPAGIAEHWSIEELEPVLLHELAHVKRWDLLVNLVQIVVQAVYFFHPLVWFVNARIRQERELVCDDLAVLHSGGSSKRYGQSFVRVLEELLSDAPLFEAPSAGMTERRKPLARRIIRIMSKDYRGHRPLGWIATAALLLVSAAMIAVAAERAVSVAAIDIASVGSQDLAAPAGAAAESIPAEGAKRTGKIKLGLVFSYANAIGLTGWGEPYGFEHHVQAASLLRLFGFDVYAVIEPETRDKAEMRDVLQRTGLTDRCIEINDAEALKKLEVIMSGHQGEIPAATVKALVPIIESGVGFVNLMGLGSWNRAAAKEAEALLGVYDGEFWWTADPPRCTVAGEHPILGALKKGSEFIVDIAEGIAGGELDGQPLLAMDEDPNMRFVPLYVRQCGKGRVVNIQIFSLSPAGAPYNFINLLPRCLKWAAGRQVPEKW